MDDVVEDRGDLCYLPATEALRLFRETAALAGRAHGGGHRPR